MKLKELQPRMPVTVSKSESLSAVAKLLVDEDIGALVVVGHGLEGVISERDLVRAIADDCDLDEMEVCDYMTEAAVVSQEEAVVGDAVSKMNSMGIRHVVVSSQGDISGVISMRDIVALLPEDWSPEGT